MLTLISTILFVLIGLICLTMAVKCLTATRILPFHEQACGFPIPLQRILSVLTIRKY
jgi:hypothetical protein